MHALVLTPLGGCRYATLKRGDIITAVNGEVVLDLEFTEIKSIIFKAGMPVTLTVLSGRIEFTQRRAREYHEMLDNEVEVEDPFEMIWYEGKRAENDAKALALAAKAGSLADCQARCTMEGANVNGRTLEVSASSGCRCCGRYGACSG